MAAEPMITTRSNPSMISFACMAVTSRACDGCVKQPLQSCYIPYRYAKGIASPLKAVRYRRMG
jgi:hypothetical protein